MSKKNYISVKMLVKECQLKTAIEATSPNKRWFKLLEQTYS